MPFNKKLYPPDWKSISDRIRFERAGGKCEACGAEHLQPHPLTGFRVVLATAHLNHDTADNRDENLMALCQRCHLNHDRADNAWRAKYGKLSPQIQLKLPL